MSKARILRIVLALALLPTGAVLVLVAGPGPVGQLMSNVGLALIVAGAVSAFRELAILRLEVEETGEDIAKRVSEQLLEFLPGTSGIRRIASERRGYAGYSTWAWAINAEPKNLFFAGRSVLHRIDADFKAHGFGSVEEVLVRKLKEGSTIRILFIDPRSEIVGRLAKEEGQTLTAILSDIATSTSICKRLYTLLKQESNFHTKGQLHIRVYDEVPYFAYHKEDNKVIVGFYFATVPGTKSPAFEIVDVDIQNLFEGHFISIFDRASDKILLEFSAFRRAPVFNESLYQELYLALVNKIGKETTDQLLSRSLSE